MRSRTRRPTTAPWYVMPADHKWYRNWAVADVLVETLEEMDPQYPVARGTLGRQLDAVAAVGLGRVASADRPAP